MVETKKPTTATVKWFNPAKGFGFTEPADVVHVSDVGSNLRQSLTAAESVLGVVKELNVASEQSNDPVLKARFEDWANTLTDAVLTVSSSADSTATEITSLYAPPNAKREK